MDRDRLLKHYLLLAHGAMGGAKYYRRVIGLVGQSSIVAYWPLWEAGGATAYDIVHGRNGTYSGPLPGQAGIGDGRTSAYFDGVNDLADVYSAGLSGAFNGEEGTFAMWGIVENAGVWADGASRYMGYFYVDGGNRIFINKSTVASQMTAYYIAASTTKVRTITLSTAGWFHAAITWTKAGDAVKAYINGVQQGATLTALGAWAGSIGQATLSTVSSPWQGRLAHGMICSRALSAGELAKIVSLA